MTEAQNILEELRQEAEFDSEGHFTLDKSKAREKMKKYQLIDPHYYVLELIQAAVASEATKIHIYLDSDDFVLQFDGLPYSRENLSNLYSSLFISQKDLTLERYREMAIGINSAQGLNPRFIKIISGNGEECHQMNIVPPAEDCFAEPEEIIMGTKIHVKEKASWRVAMKFINKHIVDKLPDEGKIIEERCAYCRVPIEINERLINPALDDIRLPEVLCQAKFESGGISGIIGIPLAPFELSHLQFVKWGTLITTRHMRLSFIPVTGIIYADHLIKNASQSDIVENDIFKETLKNLKENLDKVILALVREYDKFNPATEYSKKFKARDILLEVIESKFRVKDFQDNPTELLSEIAELDLFETTTKETVNLRTLVNQYKKLNYLPFSRKYFSYPHPDEHTVVFISDEKFINFFSKIFQSKIKNVEQEFYRIRLRESNIKKWEESQGEKNLLMFDPMVSHGFKAQGVTGEIGVVNRTPEDYSRISFFIKNGKIADKALELDGLYLNGVINNDNLNPKFTWDNLKIDSVFTNTIKTVLSQTPGLYLKLAEQYKTKDTLEVENLHSIRSHLLRFINFALGPPKEQMSHKPEEKKQENAPPSTTREFKVYELTGSGQVNADPVKIDAFEVEDLVFQLPRIYAELKLFHTASEKFVSLEDLRNEIDRFSIINYIEKNLPGPQIYEGSILIIEDKWEMDLLKKYFGWHRLKNYEKELIDERNSLKHMLRPKEEPVLTESMLEKASFSIDECRGEIGLMEFDGLGSYSYKYQGNSRRPSDSLENSILVKLLKKNIYITTRPVNLNISGLKATVNYDNLNVNSNWNNIVEDQEWEKLTGILQKASGELAEKLIESAPWEYSPVNLKKIREFILQFTAGQYGRLDGIENPETDKMLEKILKLPLLHSNDGGDITLKELLADGNSHGKIAYITKSIEQGHVEGRKVCLATPGEIKALKLLFGEENLENLETKLTAAVLADMVKKSKPEELPEIDKSGIICKIPVRNKEITGEMGLVQFRYSTRGSGTILRLLREKRFICTKTIKTPVQMKAAFNYDRLSVNSNWNAIEENREYEYLLGIINESADTLMEEMLKTYDSLDGEDKNDAGFHILQYISSKSRNYSDLTEEPADSLLGRMAAVPVFQALGSSSLVSFKDLADYYKEKKTIHYVKYHDDHKPLDPSMRVLVLNQYMAEIIGGLFKKMKDFTRDMADEKIAVKNMAAPKIENLILEKGFILKESIDKAGMKGELGLPNHLPAKKQIIFAKQMIPVTEKPVYPNSKVFGIVNNDDFTANSTFSDILLFLNQKRIILETVYKLYDRLTEKYEKMGDASEKEVARRLILDFYLDQEKFQESQFKILETTLANKIMGLPLLPIMDNRFISIERFNSELARLGYVQFLQPHDRMETPSEDIILKFDKFSFDYDFCQKLIGMDNIKYNNDMLTKQKLERESETLKLQKEDAMKKLMEKLKREKEEQDAKLKAAKSLAVKAHVEPAAGEKSLAYEILEKQLNKDEFFTEIHEDLPPEMRLLYNLKQEFRIIRQRGDYKLSEKILNKMKIEYIEEDKPIIFQKENQIVIINGYHPLIKRISESIESKPVMLYYLISMIYSTINKELLEVTDEDEMKFQMIMLENLLEHPTFSRAG